MHPCYDQSLTISIQYTAPKSSNLIHVLILYRNFYFTVFALLVFSLPKGFFTTRLYSRTALSSELLLIFVEHWSCLSAFNSPSLICFSIIFPLTYPLPIQCDLKYYQISLRKKIFIFSSNRSLLVTYYFTYLEKLRIKYITIEGLQFKTDPF